MGSFLYATDKDFEKAKILERRGNSFGYPNVLSNSKRVAKAFKNLERLIGRYEAVLDVWGQRASFPFAQRIAELSPDSEYATAFYEGLSYGETGMNAAPRVSYKNETLYNLFYVAMHSSGRFGGFKN